MRIVIVGAGRTGSALANQLDAEGHSVGVVDADPAARDALNPGFGGPVLTGSGLSQASLEAAGVAEADALVALTGSDGVNVVTARAARDRYRVPRVLARLHHPDHAGLYAAMEVATVDPLRWAVNHLHRQLTHHHLVPDQSFGAGDALLVRSGIPDYLEGRSTQELEVDGEIRVVEITRRGHSIVPARGSLLQQGDTVSFVVAAGSVGRLRSFLGQAGAP